MTTAFDIISAINARIAELNYSKNRLARNCGVHRVTLANQLKQKQAMRLDTACAALHWLGLDLQIVYRTEEKDEL